jgi:hypothetical protein
MNRFRDLWGRLPRFVKVFVYLSISALLAQLASDLSLIDGVWVPYALIPVNIGIVVLQEYLPPVVNRIRR